LPFYYNGIGNYQKALKDFSKAIELDQQFADGYYNIALFNARRGELEKTIRFLSKAIKLDAGLKQRAKAELNFNNFINSKVFRDLVN